jgi:hypothetical protein
MSIGALELSSLFRKYTGTLADIDLDSHDATRSYNNTKRDLGKSRLENKKTLSNKMAGQGLANSGISLEENVNLEKAYTTAGADADAQHQANLSRLAKQRLDAKGDYNEGTALSKMTSLLQK